MGLFCILPGAGGGGGGVHFRAMIVQFLFLLIACSLQLADVQVQAHPTRWVFALQIEISV